MEVKFFVLPRNFKTFVCGGTFERELLLFDLSAAFFHDQIDVVIGPIRLMVKKNAVFYAGFIRQFQREEVMGMPPADLIDILFGRIRCIMYEHIGAFGELNDALIRITVMFLELLQHDRFEVGHALSGLLIERFVVAHVNDGFPFIVDPVSNGESGMVHIDRTDMRIEDGEFFLTDAAEIKVRFEFVQLDGEIDLLHLVGDDVLQIDLFPVRADNGDLIPGNKCRFEERKSLDMVPMRMSDEDVCFDGLAVCDKVIAEVADAGAGIQDDEFTVVQTEFDRRSIPSVSHGILSRCRDGTAYSPEFQFHRRDPFEVRTIGIISAIR